MIRKYTLLALQKAINRALALDPTMPQKLAAFHGKVLEIIITPLNVHFYIQFMHQELHLLYEYAGAPDTIIHSSPLGLIRLSLLPSSKVRSVFNDKIRLSGDIELGHHVKNLFDTIDIDWEGHLAHFTGDVVAYQIGSLVKRGLACKNQLAQSLQQNVSEYVHDELRWLPNKEELHHFYTDVDALVLEVERLAAHVNRLLGQHETT